MSQFFDNGGKGPLGKMKSREEKEAMIKQDFEFVNIVLHGM
jgi:hypothetical protein